ncbi:MAG: hypothetical protein ACXWC6_12075 [Ramlibacter sp.]
MTFEIAAVVLQATFSRTGATARIAAIGDGTDGGSTTPTAAQLRALL